MKMGIIPKIKLPTRLSIPEAQTLDRKTAQWHVVSALLKSHLTFEMLNYKYRNEKHCNIPKHLLRWLEDVTVEELKTMRMEGT